MNPMIGDRKMKAMVFTMPSETSAENPTFATPAPISPPRRSNSTSAFIQIL